MKVYLAGTYSRPYVLGGGGNGYLFGRRSNWEPGSSMEKEGPIREGEMRLYLAGEHPVKNGSKAIGGGQFILESFYYARDNNWLPKLIPGFGDFLLDSGAFTFMSNTSNKCDWDLYTEEYAGFINRYEITKFFELDIDSIVGLKEVERLRKKLEILTGKKPIPVWHLSRGKDYFIKMSQEYPYVAIGGIVTQEIPRKKYEAAFPWFIRTAHQYGAKIHGLGYTSLEGLHKYHFDSVDSTAWLYGNRGGYLYKFNPAKGNIDKIDAPGGRRLKSQEAALWNFNEWVKFQQYALKNL